MTVSFVGEGDMAGALLQPSNTPLVVRGSVRGWGQSQGVGSVSGSGVSVRGWGIWRLSMYVYR